jgi:predicted RNase H-like nuclease
VSFTQPDLVSFDEALAFINAENSTCDTCLVALDQPTIVRNRTGSRERERPRWKLPPWKLLWWRQGCRC